MSGALGIVRRVTRRPIVLALLLSSAACGDDKGDALPPDANNGDGDGDADAAVDAPSIVPIITSVDYPVIAHGARLIITGTDLDGTTDVTIGGVSHTDIVPSTDSIIVRALDPSVAVALAQPVTVTSPLGTSDPFDVTVIHLVISEIDPDTPGADTEEFVELDTGLAEVVSLDGYVLAFFNGNSPQGDLIGSAIDLAADTAATGLLVVGSNTLPVTPQILFAGPIQAGEDGAGVFQFPGDVATFPATLGPGGLLDGVIWESGDDADSASIAPLVSDGVVVNEGDMSAQREGVSIQRCLGDQTPRLGAAYGLLAPSAGVANSDC